MHIGEGDSLWNGPFFHISDLCDHDPGSGHMACYHISHIDFYLDTKFGKTIMDRRTYMRPAY